MSHAAAAHRNLDRRFIDALARDGEPGHVGALLPSRNRLKDMRTMSASRVLLTTLSRRTSTKGNEYLAGWLGKASVVAFPGQPDKFGNPTWDLFLSQPEPRDGLPAPRRQATERQAASAGPGALPATGTHPGGCGSPPGNSRPNAPR